MSKVKFEDLEIGQRFKYNLMYWKKKSPSAEDRKGRSVYVNSSFVSDDHYESYKTDQFIGSAGASFNGDVMVEPIDSITRREKELANT